MKLSTSTLMDIITEQNIRDIETLKLSVYNSDICPDNALSIINILTAIEKSITI